MNQDFLKLLKTCRDVGISHIGGNNPDAKILFVGKESSGFIEYDKLDYWEKVQSGESPSPSLEYPKSLIKGKGGTWHKYQKLHDLLFEKENNKHLFDFQRRIFTAEMNSDISKTTKDAQGNRNFFHVLLRRKELFFKSDFVKSFPIVLLACWDYIQPQEIYEIFEVKYDVSKSCPSKEIYGHTSESDRNRLVIHCYQLSGRNRYVTNDYLKEIAFIIRNHLIEIGQYEILKNT
jgi:hypothetical protein